MLWRVEHLLKNIFKLNFWDFFVCTLFTSASSATPQNLLCWRNPCRTVATLAAALAVKSSSRSARSHPTKYIFTWVPRCLSLVPIGTPPLPQASVSPQEPKWAGTHAYGWGDGKVPILTTEKKLVLRLLCVSSQHLLHFFPKIMFTA